MRKLLAGKTGIRFASISILILFVTSCFLGCTKEKKSQPLHESAESGEKFKVTPKKDSVSLKEKPKVTPTKRGRVCLGENLIRNTEVHTATTAKFVHDGDKDTYWNIEEGLTKGEVEISWRAPKEINLIKIYPYGRTKKYSLSAFDADGKVVFTTNNNLSSLEECKFSPRLIKSIKITLYAHPGAGGIREIEAYNTSQNPSNASSELSGTGSNKSGRVSTTSSGSGKNLALDCEKSSTTDATLAGHVNDGDKETYWQLNSNLKQGFIKISLNFPKIINKIRVYPEGEKLKGFKLDVYDDKKWNSISGKSKIADYIDFDFPPTRSSSIKLSFASPNGGGGVREIEAYNTLAKPPVNRSSQLIKAMKASSAVALFYDSPYGFSQKGRELLQPRIRDFVVSDQRIDRILDYVCKRLDGLFTDVTPKGSDSKLYQIELNGIKSKFQPDAFKNLNSCLSDVAQKHKLEVYNNNSLIILGRSIKELKEASLIKELSILLGKNPALIDWAHKFEEPDAIVTPTQEVKGVTYEWYGIRANFHHGYNLAAWLKYLDAKVIRTWFSEKDPRRAIRLKKNEINTLEEMEKIIAEVRKNPEGSRYIDWKYIKRKFKANLDKEFGAYNKLGLTIINCTGPKIWDDNLTEDCRVWLSTYVTAYILARDYDVAVHQFGNEPDWYLNKLSDDKIAYRIMLAGDAIHSAVEDVNSRYKKNLTPIYSAPVLASRNSLETIGGIMMRNLRNRFNGRKSEKDIVQLFNRHRYGGNPEQNRGEVEMVKNIMMKNAGRTIPQVFTEINYATGKRWSSSETEYTNDTPYVFSAMACLWGEMMDTQGVYGVFLFKLNHGEGPFHNVVTDVTLRENDHNKEIPGTITYNYKNSEVYKLFSRAFRSSRPLHTNKMYSSDERHKTYTSYDKNKDCYYLWSVHRSNNHNLNTEFDLSKLNIPAGTPLTVEAVSEAAHGEIVATIDLPKNQKLRLCQPAESAILLTIPKSPLKETVILPQVDSMIAQGNNRTKNFGKNKWLEVRRHTDNNLNRVSYIRFNLPEGVKKISHAQLKLYGNSEGSSEYDRGFLTRIYTVNDQNWQENNITGDNAPNLYRTVASAVDVDYENYPVGHVTSFKTPRQVGSMVTNCLQEALDKGKKQVTFMLIRERHWSAEDTDTTYARFASREAGSRISPKLKIYSK